MCTDALGLHVFNNTRVKRVIYKHIMLTCRFFCSCAVFTSNKNIMIITHCPPPIISLSERNTTASVSVFFNLTKDLRSNTLSAAVRSASPCSTLWINSSTLTPWLISQVVTEAQPASAGWVKQMQWAISTILWSLSDGPAEVWDLKHLSWVKQPFSGGRAWLYLTRASGNGRSISSERAQEANSGSLFRRIFFLFCSYWQTELFTCTDHVMFCYIWGHLYCPSSSGTTILNITTVQLIPSVLSNNWDCFIFNEIYKVNP